MYRVMLVEDDSVIRYVYKRMKVWQEQGFVIEQEASNGSQAVAALKDNPVDLVFTDIRMPLMDGITLMKNVQEFNPDILFALISSYNEFEYAREGLRLGALDYIVKPMAEKDLEEALIKARKILGERSSDDMMQKMSAVCQQEINMQDPLLLKLCKYLEENTKRNITIENAADALLMSRDYLGKQIKSKTGQNFRTLYHQIKMEYAKSMMKNGNYKIYEISEALGYTSADYFTQQFKKIVGMTPAEFKKI